MTRRNKHRAREERRVVAELAKPKENPLDGARRQIRTAGKIAAIALVIVWLLALGLWSGLQSFVPLIVAGAVTAAALVLVVLVRRNLTKSEELGSLLTDGVEISDEERALRIGKLEERFRKGDASAALAKAQLEMQESPKGALVTLEAVDLEKAPKVLASQVRAMRAMVHLNLGEIARARELADAIDLSKAPDAKSRANLSSVVAEAWARSGNPIEATQLLDKYDVDQKDFEELRMQLLRARAFAAVHHNDLKGMRRALKSLVELSPQLLTLFVGQKRVHPLLQQEAKKLLEKSGLMPKPKFQLARR